jgi:hypothetical protein
LPNVAQDVEPALLRYVEAIEMRDVEPVAG